MAYVPVPKDLTKVKTKVALNLTKRQLIFFSLAAVVGIPFYLFMRKPIGSSIAAILMVTIMLPFFFMAMFSVAAYTVILAFSLFKTGSLSKSIFNAH